LTVPSAEVAETGVKVYADVKERGYKSGRATGDRAYGPGTDVNKYQIPMRRMGYELYMDYKDNQLGAKQGHYKGAVMVEGGFYCPKMPEDLVNATSRLRAKEITLSEYRQLIERRVKYKLRAKEKPDEKGRVPMMCPARGPGATAECPIAQACGGGVVPKRADDDTLISIFGDTPSTTTARFYQSAATRYLSRSPLKSALRAFSPVTTAAKNGRTSIHRTAAQSKARTRS
jgi:hypothetical protein